MYEGIKILIFATMNKLRRIVSMDIIRNPYKVVPYIEHSSNILRYGEIVKLKYLGMMVNGTHGLITDPNACIRYKADISIKGSMISQIIDIYVHPNKANLGLKKALVRSIDKYIEYQRRETLLK